MNRDSERIPRGDTTWGLRVSLSRTPCRPFFLRDSSIGNSDYYHLTFGSDFFMIVTILIYNACWRHYHHIADSHPDVVLTLNR
jgi:hypothetical protein